MIDCLYEEVPGLEQAIASNHWITEPQALWELLKGLMEAHSPTGSLALPGTILDTLSSVARQAGLGANFIPNFNNTGNPSILLGVKKGNIDLLVDAHLDKPTFGVVEVTRPEDRPRDRPRDRQRAVLFPYCANRFPAGEYQVLARALRYDEAQGRVKVCGKGVLISRRSSGQNDELLFEVNNGEIELADLVVLDTPAQRQVDEISGPGLDNAAGVTMLLAAASVLKEIESQLEDRGVNCLLTFSDQEEGPAGSLFAQGASRTAFALPPPRLGSVVVDVHSAGEGYLLEPGRGASFGFVSGGDRGALVPLNYQRLQLALFAALNLRWPGAAQHNRGYFSRSDEFALVHWSKIVGLLGIPVADIHTGHEKGNLRDLQGGILCLSHYLPVVLGLSPTLAKRYQPQIFEA